MLASTFDLRGARAAPLLRQRLVTLVLDPGRTRRWHLWLLESLRALPGVRVALHAVEESTPLPASLEALLKLEQTIYGGTPGLERIATDQLPVQERLESLDGPGVIIDLAGLSRSPEGGHHLLPLFDGAFGLPALLAALLEQRSPRLSLLRNGHVQQVGLPAVEDFSLLSRGADFVLAHMVAALARAAQDCLIQPPGPQPRAPAAWEEKPPVHLAALKGARHLLASLARKAVRRIAAHGRWPRWRCGWRRLGNVREGLRHSWHAPDMARYDWLQDDGRRFFADPFAVARNGLVHVFVEELPHASGRGLISHFTIDACGRASAPRPVLEADVHLSYPFLFAHGGVLYMIPESEEAREVRLYRCVEFPHRWKAEAVLIAGRPLSDATIHHDGERFWLFAAQRLPHGSSWDTLAVFTAERLHGPWREVAAPALVDAGAARPAGSLWRQGVLLRPAQDCRGDYGAGLAICHVEHLDEEHFSQRVLAQVRPPQPWHGLHTLNLAGGFELIDAVN